LSKAITGFAPGSVREAFSIYLKSPWTFVCILALFAGAPLLVVNLVELLIWLPMNSGSSDTSHPELVWLIPILLVALLVEVLAYIVAQGIIASAIQKQKEGTLVDIWGLVRESSCGIKASLIASGLCIASIAALILLQWLFYIVLPPLQEHTYVFYAVIETLITCIGLGFLYFITRFIFMSIVTINERLGPIASMRRSWSLSKGVWFVAACTFGLLALASGIVATIPDWLSYLISAPLVKESQIAIQAIASIFSIIISLTLDSIALITVAVMYFKLTTILPDSEAPLSDQPTDTDLPNA
jgi:hypothetical protein